MDAEIFEFTGAKIKFGNVRLEIVSSVEEINLSTTTIHIYQTEPWAIKQKIVGFQFPFYPLLFAVRNYFKKISTDKIEIKTRIPRWRVFLKNTYVQKWLSNRLLNGEYFCEGFLENSLRFIKIKKNISKYTPQYTIEQDILEIKENL